MNAFESTVDTDKPFDDAVSAVERKAAEKDFRVLHTHDLAAMLAEKGFPREPLKIIEVCNAKYASQMLNRDVKLSLGLPCPISVYIEDGKTRISALPRFSIAELFPEAGIEELTDEVESVVLQIVNEARRFGSTCLARRARTRSDRRVKKLKNASGSLRRRHSCE